MTNTGLRDPPLTPLVQAHLDIFRQQSRVQAGSLIISVFGDAVLPRGGGIWLGSLIRLLQPLNLSERLIRTSVFRLAKEEWLRTETAGRRANYCLTLSGQRRFEEASRHIYAATAPLWDRRWRLILTVGEIDSRERERLRRALFWQGFGLIGTDCFVHPSADLGNALDFLTSEGMADTVNKLMPFLADKAALPVSASDSDMVRRAWNLEQLAQAYQRFVLCYQPLLDAVGSANQGLSDEDAFLLRTLLIHDYRRLLLRDPELPDILLNSQWPGQKARLLTATFYRQLLEPSERHLDQQLQLANNAIPAATPLLVQRFQNVPKGR